MVRQNILIIMLIVILSATVYIWYQYLDLGISAPEGEPTTDEFESELQDLRSLNTLQINTGILQNPLLKALEQPPTGTTTRVRQGRENPFLPF